MSKKRRSPDRPVCFCGRLAFEFFLNDDESFKQRSLLSLCKEARRQFNISCLSVEEHEVENPEHGSIVFSLCAPSQEKGKAQLDRVLAFFDENAPARIRVEEIQEAEIP